MKKKNRDKETEEEQFLQGTSFMIIGTVIGGLMSMVGGFISNYLGIFSRDQLLENPLGQSIGATVIFFLFITTAFLMISTAFLLQDIYNKKERLKPLALLWLILKKGWKWYVPSIIFFCPLTFWYLYQNATSVVL